VGPIRKAATGEVNSAYGGEIAKSDLSDNRCGYNAEEEIPIGKKMLSHDFTLRMTKAYPRQLTHP